MIKTIIIIVLGIVLGVLIAFPISKILMKKHKAKISDNAVKKILEQKEANFKTSSGKPTKLKFMSDGKDVDLVKEIKDSLAGKELGSGQKEKQSSTNLDVKKLGFVGRLINSFKKKPLEVEPTQTSRKQIKPVRKPLNASKKAKKQVKKPKSKIKMSGSFKKKKKKVKEKKK